MKSTDMKWRDLALQFDNHRMLALWHLEALLNDPSGHAEDAKLFLSAGPLSGEEVLKQRIQEIADGN